MANSIPCSPNPERNQKLFDALVNYLDKKGIESDSIPEDDLFLKSQTLGQLQKAFRAMAAKKKTSFSSIVESMMEDGISNPFGGEFGLGSEDELRFQPETVCRYSSTHIVIKTVLDVFYIILDKSSSPYMVGFRSLIDPGFRRFGVYNSKVGLAEITEPNSKEQNMTLLGPSTQRFRKLRDTQFKARPPQANETPLWEMIKSLI